MQQEPKKHVSHAIAWSLIALFAGSLAFGIWVYFSQISDIYDNSFTISISHKKATSTKPTTTTTGTTTTDATADWKTYTNDTYGFGLTFGDIWKGYTVKEQKSTDNFSTGGISFHLKTTDQGWINQLKTNDIVPFGITVYTPSQWNNGNLEGEVPTYITKNDKYVFAYSMIQDRTVSDMQAINTDVKNVISTFTFTN